MRQNKLIISALVLTLSVNALAIGEGNEDQNKSWTEVAAECAAIYLLPYLPYVAAAVFTGASAYLGTRAIFGKSIDSRLAALEPTFEKIGTFAVNDAVSFSHVIPASELKAVSDKAKARLSDEKAKQKNKSEALGRTLEFEADKVRKGSAKYDPNGTRDKMRQVAEAVESGESGICTTFAFSAAHLVLKASEGTNIRVEVVAHKEGTGTHLYAIVGRKLGSDLNDRTTWGAEARIVDLWLRAMFNNTVKFVCKPEEYPEAFLQNLKSIFDSSAGVNGNQTASTANPTCSASTSSTAHQHAS